MKLTVEIEQEKGKPPYIRVLSDGQVLGVISRFKLLREFDCIKVLAPEGL